MSDRFPSIRHLAGYVETQLAQFTQLKAAVDEVVRVAETLTDRQQQVVEIERQMEPLQQKLRDLAETRDAMMAELAEQRRDLQALRQTEDQQRHLARQQFEVERETWREERVSSAAMSGELDEQIAAKRRDLEELEMKLAETVQAHLAKR